MDSLKPCDINDDNGTEICYILPEDELEKMKLLGLPTNFKSTKHTNFSQVSGEILSPSLINSRPNKKKKKNKSKYWHQRYRLFSRFDEGIKIDSEGWYTVTPEKIAGHIAERCSNYSVIWDPFCGIGGNCIQFAHLPNVIVLASDINPKKVSIAKHNAYIYGVREKICFFVADFFQIQINADCIFLSPPWGGPDYINSEVFSLEMMKPHGQSVYETAKKITDNIAFLLPRNIDCNEIKQLLKKSEEVEIEENFLNYKVKTLTAYFGGLVKS